ncbi:endonuclease MutS2 [Reichenbachiella versicolor]|uniref:endonuclease MutS2 n=1 Tax=Reichenbachiella versicolor TaxID=1821036 RepID=UPI000D6DD12C|nr:endonuclease MutS2 [Reichenbachiella versicolor]
MRAYPLDLEAKLSFDKVKDILEENCISDMGKTYAQKVAISSHTKKINEWLSQTREFIHILTSSTGFPQSGYIDVSTHLKQCEIPGTFLDEDLLFDIKLVLDTLIKVNRFFKENGEEYPISTERFSNELLDEGLHHHLDLKIDEKGLLRDNASRELMEIREKISKAQIRARTSVNKILKQANGHGYTPEDAGLTIRDGRLVIPVLAEHKRHIKGFVHDESSTGQTVYLEPAEVLEINNEVRELKYAERREIIRILTELTDHVRINSEGIKKGLKMLGIIDFVRAKAQFAVDYNCICPELSNQQLVEWQNARHPILEKSLKSTGKKIVPLNIKLDKEDRILLISGPNAGGKSVCLKTIGLIQYMIQSGIPVSVGEGSKFGTFDSIFIDIGDEQSIENDLSTYSSHLTNMKYFLENAGKKTIFLIDEFGTGTEPQFGGAIAETVLFELNKMRTYGAITTHYGNLKKLADKQKGIINAAMKYDVKRLEPMYELEIGKPGSSFALEIAGKIGLDKDMLERAKKKAGVSHVQFDRLLNELENEKNHIDKQKKEIEAKNQRLADSIKDYEDLKVYLEKQKSKVISEAKQEASRVIKESNKKIEATIKQIQESKADKKRTLEAREKLKSHEAKLERQPKKKEAPKVAVAIKDIDPVVKVGDKVKIIKSGAAGEVVSIKGKDLELQLGGLTSRVKLKDVEKISSKQYKQTAENRVQQITGIDLNKKMAMFSPTLDIRGVRAEEAIGKVEDYIDEALLLGHTEVKILHGKGHGILRDLVRNVLRGNHKIISAVDEHVERGGAGITVVTLEE